MTHDSYLSHTLSLSQTLSLSLKLAISNTLLHSQRELANGVRKALEGSIGRLRVGREQLLWDQNVPRETHTPNQHPPQNPTPYPTSLLTSILDKFSQNLHNLPQALLIEVQHGEISMKNDEWQELMHETMRSMRREAKNHATSHHHTNDTTSSTSNKPKTPKKGSLFIRVSTDLKPKETIHNYIVRNSSQSLFNRLSYSSLDFVTEAYQSILVVIDSRTIPLDKIIQWMRVARKYHNKILICTVIEVKRHDMFINALPNSLVADFHLELFKRSPSKREVIFSLINNYLIEPNHYLPFRLTHDLFDKFLDACTIRNDDCNYFSTFMTSVTEMMLSTQKATPLVFYTKWYHEDDERYAKAFEYAIGALSRENWRMIQQLGSLRSHTELVQAIAEIKMLPVNSTSRLAQLMQQNLRALFTFEEFNVLMLDCFLAMWRAVRGHHLLHEEEIHKARFKYVAQRIILHRDFLKVGSFSETTMIRAARRHIKDVGLTYVRYTALLDAFERIFKRHSEVDQNMQENLQTTREELLDEYRTKQASIFEMEVDEDANGNTTDSKESLQFTSVAVLELLDVLQKTFVRHYTECPLWELYYADPIESQRSKSESVLSETLTAEDWMNTTMSHGHRLHLLYAHHSQESPLSQVFLSMRKGGQTESTQYEEYLLDTDQEDSVELQRQWYALMRTVKGTGLKQ